MCVVVEIQRRRVGSLFDDGQVAEVTVHLVEANEDAFVSSSWASKIHTSFTLLAWVSISWVVTS